MYNIGRLGESLVKQEKELNERIKEIESHSQDDEIRPELRSKLPTSRTDSRRLNGNQQRLSQRVLHFWGRYARSCMVLIVGKYGISTYAGMESPTKTEFSDKVLYLLQRINRARGKLEMPLHANMTSNSQPTSVKVYLRKSGNYKLYSHNGPET